MAAANRDDRPDLVHTDIAWGRGGLSPRVFDLPDAEICQVMVRAGLDVAARLEAKLRRAEATIALQRDTSAGCSPRRAAVIDDPAHDFLILAEGVYRVESDFGAVLHVDRCGAKAASCSAS